MNEKTITSKTFTRSLEGTRDFEGSLTYTQEGTYDEILRDSPEPGVQSKHFPSDCVCQTVSATPTGGNLWSVVCKFNKRAVESLGFERGPKERNVSIHSQKTDISILLHPLYNGKFKEGLKGVLERLLKSSVNELMYPPQMPDHGSADDYTADTSAKKITIKEFFHGYIKQAAIRDVDLWIDLYTRITEKGIKNFPAFHYIVKETEIVDSCKLSKELGKICKPSWSKIPNLPWGGNWLLTKEDFTWKENLQKWERLREFTSSDNGHKWAEAIYKV